MKAKANPIANGLDLTGEQLKLSNRSVKQYRELQELGNESGKRTLELGETLSLLKEALGHGKWGEYCKAFAHVYSDRSIRRFIQVYSNRTLVSDCKTQHEQFIKLGMVKDIELPKEQEPETNTEKPEDEKNGKTDPKQETPKKKSKRSVYLRAVRTLKEMPTTLTAQEIDEIIKEAKPFIDWCKRQKSDLPVVEQEAIL